MSATPQPIDDRRRLLRFEGPVNFRDIGGYKTLDGRAVKWGHVYRADGLWRMTEPDLAAFAALNIRVVFDLRSSGEREEYPDPMLSRQIDIERRVPREEFVDGSPLQTENQAIERLQLVYRLALETGLAPFGELMTALAQEDSTPAVFHCAGGKDRTGLVAALLLELLGVERATILDDYELTNECVTAERSREVLEMFLGFGMGHEAATSFLRAHRSVMAGALDWIKETFGGAEQFLKGPGGIDDEVVDTLRYNLLA